MKMLERISSEIEATRQAARKSARDGFAEFFSEFFNNHPEVESVLWRQYTPYFNDGDTCTFDVHDICVELKPQVLALAQDGTPLTPELVEQVLKAKVDPEVDADEDDDFAYEGHNHYIGTAPRPNAEYGWQRDDRAQTPLEQALLADIQSLSAVDSDLFLFAFGDHAKVRATRDGISVTRYDHD